MTKAYITTWYNYSKSFGTEYYKILFDYWLKQLPLWSDCVDKIYLIDVNWGLTVDDLRKLPRNCEIVYSPIEGHHNKQYQEFIPKIKEDAMLFMDNDVLITKREGISKWFELAEQGKDAVISHVPNWSNYPPGDLREPIWAKFPEIKDKGIYMDSCHFLITKQFLSKIGKLDFMNYQPYPEGTYIPELNYTTKKGEWCEFFSPLWFQILKHNNWVEMPKIEGYQHYRALSYAYLILSYKKYNSPQYKELHLPDFKSRLEMFKKIDTEGKYYQEIDEILKTI